MVTMGVKSMINSLTTGPTKIATGTGEMIAMVLGKTSAKTKTSTVTITVAMATPFEPNRSVSSAVVNAADKILAILLPKSRAPIMLSLSSVTDKAAFAPREPLSACAFNIPRDAAVRAVSEPEKKAEINKSTVTAKAVSTSVALAMIQSILSSGLSGLGQRMVVQNQILQMVF